jgi:TetR/AcrR family transcriptional regulator
MNADDQSARGPGRPAGDQSQAVSRRLLDACRELCIDVGLDAASTKTIAARAGVNPAMINYYFGGKEALSQAMMRDAIAPVLDEIESAAGRVPMPTLERFVEGYMRTLAEHPWLPRLVVREVLPANGRFRELFMQELVGPATRLLPKLVVAEQEAGRIDAELDSRHLILSIMSLAIFPFLAAPIVEAALGIRMSEKGGIDRVVEHTLEFLRHGSVVGGRS